MALPPVVLGIDFGGTKIAAAVCDATGARLATAVTASYSPAGDGSRDLTETGALTRAGRPTPAELNFERGLRLARELLTEHAPDRPLAGVGVATFGIPFDDRVELAPAIDGWENLPLGRKLAAAFPGVPVRMATDAKAAAQAEVSWGSLAGCDPAIYVNLGTGLSAAIVAGGGVLAGGRGAAGEIGYSLRDRADVGRAASLRVPLEDMVSGQALQRRAADLSGRPLTAAEVFAAGHDAALGDLVSEFIDELAFHLVNLSIAVDPVRIAVGGGLTGSWERIRPRLQDALASAAPYPPELVLAAFPAEAPLLGAVALAVEALSASASRSAHSTAAQPIGHYSTNLANSAYLNAPTNSATKG